MKIKDAKYFINIGITQNERQISQEIKIDFHIEYDFKKAMNSDKIEDTLDYCILNDYVIDFFKKNKFNLIESCTYSLAKNLYEKFNLKKIKINLKKPNALNNAKYVSFKVKYP